MGQRRGEKGRVTGAQVVELAVHLKVDLPRDHEAELFADVTDQTIAAAAGREIKNVRLEQTAHRRRDHPLKPDIGALVFWIDVDSRSQVTAHDADQACAGIWLGN